MGKNLKFNQVLGCDTLLLFCVFSHYVLLINTDCLEGVATRLGVCQLLNNDTRHISDRLTYHIRVSSENVAQKNKYVGLHFAKLSEATFQHAIYAP